MTPRPWVKRAVAIVPALLVAVCMTSTAHAGRTCEDKPLATDAVVRGMALADKVKRQLDATGAQVVVLARAGQDLSEWRLQWSHLGFAYRDATVASSDGKGVWRVAHKLNHCGTAHGVLYRQGLGEFFLDRPASLRGCLCRAEPGGSNGAASDAAQQLPAVASGHRPTTTWWPTHGPRATSRATNGRSRRWPWPMEPAATSRRRRSAGLQFKGYEPTTLNIGAFKRLGARVGTAHIAFDDHPSSKRYSDRIETVTVDSVFAWLPGVGLGDKLQHRPLGSALALWESTDT